MSEMDFNIVVKATASVTDADGNPVVNQPEGVNDDDCRSVDS